eukprot:gnl/TRDRNA2_/TRDRNA2_40838_c0_seq2.p1 gnl/TRDRNA2_/TRDRNA2_40838_c0~~gnl/TRDRNA2_/TRDRNA2_40838_c0_seq2.p1  ORF type:complete len:335 (-),score=26.85 gnl/TRDRNA2_/TRDRNA2_40838_c0_seq2:167-1171(-)
MLPKACLNTTEMNKFDFVIYLCVAIIAVNIHQGCCLPFENAPDVDVLQPECPPEWSYFIDGKDAAKGPKAYGQTYYDNMMVALKSLGDNELTTESFMALRDKTPGILNLRNTTCFGAMCRVMLELPTCIRAMVNNSVKQEILADLPVGLVNVSYANESQQGVIQEMSLNVMNDVTIRKHLDGIFRKYNSDLQHANTHTHAQTGSVETKHQLLTSIARMLRSLAFLHPFIDGNGRIRLLVLQQEIRRLKLGCGAVMFNNNADIYFGTTETYVAKISEGIRMANKFDRTADFRNPWLEERARREHLERFPIPEGLEPHCMKVFEGNSKSILLQLSK